MSQRRVRSLQLRTKRFLRLTNAIIESFRLEMIEVWGGAREGAAAFREFVRPRAHSACFFFPGQELSVNSLAQR